MSINNLLRRCWRLYAAGEYTLLLQESNRADLSGSVSAEIEEYFYVRSMAFWRLERLQEAQQALNYVLELNPRSVQGHLQLANMWDDREDFEQADEHYRFANELEPDSAAILCDWGIMLYRANHIEQALEKFKQADRHCADDVFFHLYQGLCLEAVGELATAAMELETYLERRDDPFAMARLGVLYMEIGQYEQAEELLRDAVDAEPDEPSHLYHLALCLKRVGELDQAESIVYQLIEMDPKNDESWGLLGDLELERGNIEGAVDRYHKSLEINPNGSHTLSGLAWVYYRQQKMEMARRLCLKALKCDSGNMSALDLLRHMEPAGERLCRYAIELQGQNKDGARFFKSIECLASSPEAAADYVTNIQSLFRNEAYWEIVEINFVEPVSDDHPGVLWISDSSFV